MANFIVNNLNDSGSGSLRDAIERANANHRADSITFSEGLSGVITLSKALPDISDTLSINGLSSGQTKPIIQLDFSGNRGISFAAGSDGS